jgi:hypothetical protein
MKDSKLNMAWHSNGKRVILSSGAWGWVMSIALIAIRALSPNTIPMEEWSIASWVFLTSPITWPWLLFIVCRICWWALSCSLWMWDKITRKKGPYER